VAAVDAIAAGESSIDRARGPRADVDRPQSRQQSTSSNRAVPRLVRSRRTRTRRRSSGALHRPADVPGCLERGPRADALGKEGSEVLGRDPSSNLDMAIFTPLNVTGTVRRDSMPGLKIGRSHEHRVEEWTGRPRRRCRSARCRGRWPPRSRRRHPVGDAVRARSDSASRRRPARRRARIAAPQPRPLAVIFRTPRTRS